MNKLKLYNHNIKPYNKVKDAYNKRQKVVGIVHATGTGKTYIALQLTLDNKDKKIIYIVPKNSIIEHIKNIINTNNLDLNKDFPNLEFRTYTSLVNLSKEELDNIKYDLLILDEFHHIGAPVWGHRINSIINNNKDSLIFGMTAYTIRDRGTPYERDMALIDGNELFSNKIVSTYTLEDAIIDEVLPIPIYRSIYTKLLDIEAILEEKVLTNNLTSKEREEYLSILKDIKKQIYKKDGIDKLIKKHIKPNGKYIYFCPPGCEEDGRFIDKIKEEAYNWFKDYIKEEDIIFYTSLSNMPDKGLSNRQAFYNDTTLEEKSTKNKLRIMFCINQYNEGVHTPDIDGVILGRYTESDIVFFEQIGRALSVNGIYNDKYQEYNKYDINTLLNIAKYRDIQIPDNISKEELINILISPTIIDLTGNIDFIKELETNLKNRVKERKEVNPNPEKRIQTIKDISFDIDMINEDLFKVLSDLRERLSPLTWDDSYNLAYNYYKTYGDLKVPFRFKTKDGYTYDENGYKLGIWINNQKQNKNLTGEKRKKLESIGMRFETKDNDLQWEFNYNLVSIYYKTHKNLEIPVRFKTFDGINYDENGYKLGLWISNQRYNKNLSVERRKRLENIGMRFEINKLDLKWEFNYNLARIYYETHGDLEITSRFKTIDGINYDENGYALGAWINRQRQNKNLTIERRKLLESIGMRFESNKLDLQWEFNYNLAKVYFETYGKLEIPGRFKTFDGINYDENGYALGAWINTQRNTYNLRKDRRKLLESIGMRFETKDNDLQWESNYNLAKTYYETHGTLEIPYKFKTFDGINYDENGYKLGLWISNQRKNKNLTKERRELLDNIGMIWDIKKNKKEIIELCNKYNIDININNSILNKSYNEVYSKICFLIDNNMSVIINDELHEIFFMSDINMKANYKVNMKYLLNKYINNKGRGK